MYDGVIAGLKAATPKVLAGSLLGLPVTAVVSPMLGVLALGAMGAVCVGGMFVALKSVENAAATTEVALSTPSL